MSGDRARRAAMWVLATGVAAIAAVVSYSHIFALGREHGGSGTAARLLPLSVDMLIVVGELMLLHEADARGRRYALGWLLVWSGILATLAANVTYGAAYGPVGALIWGWPAYSFILVAAGMVSIVKRRGNTDTDGPGSVLPTPPGDAETAATAAYAASVAGGNPLSGRQLESRFGLSRAQSARVRAGSNGSGP
jgi:Protein of unknown function (DUF2637)